MLTERQKQLILDHSTTESYQTCGTCSNCNGRECGVTTIVMGYADLVEAFGHNLALQITNRTKDEEAKTLARRRGEDDE